MSTLSRKCEKVAVCESQNLVKKVTNGEKNLSDMDPDEVLREHKRLCKANADKYK